MAMNEPSTFRPKSFRARPRVCWLYKETEEIEKTSLEETFLFERTFEFTKTDFPITHFVHDILTLFEKCK